MLYASVQIRADEVVTPLLKGLPSFALELLDTQTFPQTAWLIG